MTDDARKEALDAIARFQKSPRKQIPTGKRPAHIDQDASVEKLIERQKYGDNYVELLDIERGEKKY
jgi:hypothetical protein